MLTHPQAPVRGIIELLVLELVEDGTGIASGVAIVPMDPNYGPEKYAVIRYLLGKRVGSYLEATIRNAAAIDDVSKKERNLHLNGRRCRLKL